MLPKVLVLHSGARHNYALPAAFAETGMLEAFYTDMCAGKGLGRFANIARTLPLPDSARALAKNLARRVPPPAVLARTCTDDLETLRYEAQTRNMTEPAQRHRALAEHANRRGRRMAKWGLGGATHIFNMLGEGGQLVKQAKDQGLPVLSDIMIALSTDAIEEQERRDFPDWGPATSASGWKDRNSEQVCHLLETTDVFVCPSSFVAKDLVENWNVKQSAIRTVPYALAAHWFDIRPQPIKGRILFVGSANRRKGIHYLAMAANELRIRGLGYEFRVAGNACPIVRNHPHAGPLNFLGRVPRGEVQEEYASADIFVLPTLAEGSATVVYEAMAAGLPVITTASAGSVIEHGVDGLIIVERDPSALANAVELLAEDRDLREKIAVNARRKAESFGWPQYSRSIRALVDNA